VSDREKQLAVELEQSKKHVQSLVRVPRGVI
jgi:hypothetical protein